ncbi:hypothetical protein ACQR5W_18620 [Xanthomonas sacchari]|uniref:hypothetical protein n=1 Tax=Xanthomonas TaxID=338 RepID=UPI0012FF267F|nr:MULTISPECIES: hypothetical protein [Xanthomonas]
MIRCRTARYLATFSACIFFSPHAFATKPGPIDCGKAQSIQPGWTAEQVTRNLGKPYILTLSRENMRYGWRNADGTDKIDVTFGLANPKIEQRIAIDVRGTCGGKKIEANPRTDINRNNIEIPGVPRRIEFDGNPFYLAYFAESHEDSVRHVEYVPRGQNLKGWRSMIAVFQHTDDSTPETHLELLRQRAEISGNPHFRQVYISPQKDEAIAAIPQMFDNALEYQVTRWRTTPKGTLATVYFSRHYPDDKGKFDRDAYVAQEESRIPGYLDALKSLPPILPPEIGRSGEITLTVDGTESSEVLVPTSLSTDQTPQQ